MSEERRDGHSKLRVKDGKLETFDPHPSPADKAWSPKSRAENAAIVLLTVRAIRAKLERSPGLGEAPFSDSGWEIIEQALSDVASAVVHDVGIPEIEAACESLLSSSGVDISGDAMREALQAASAASANVASCLANGKQQQQCTSDRRGSLG